MRFLTSSLFCMFLLSTACDNIPAQVNQTRIQPEIATVSTGVAICSILDTSGSMSGDKINSVKKVWAKVFSPKLRLFQSKKNNLEVALVKCGGSAKLIKEIGIFNAANFFNTIEQLMADGGTPLGEAFNTSFEELKKSKLSKKHIFALTDGQATGVNPTTVLDKHSSDNIKITIIGFLDDHKHYKSFLEKGCKVVYVDNLEDLEKTCALILDEDILKLEND